MESALSRSNSLRIPMEIALSSSNSLRIPMESASSSSNSLHTPIASRALSDFFLEESFDSYKSNNIVTNQKVNLSDDVNSFTSFMRENDMQNINEIQVNAVDIHQYMSKLFLTTQVTELG